MNLPDLKQRGENEWLSQAVGLLTPGLVLYGYCGGRFGRDSYGDKVIKKVQLVPTLGHTAGEDLEGLYIEVKEAGGINFIVIDSEEDLINLIDASNRDLQAEADGMK